jgi:hypothetical protein
MIQNAVQTILCAIWVLFASPIAGAITPQWWYGLGAILSGVQLIAAFFLLPETKYERSLSSYQENSKNSSSTDLEAESADGKHALSICTTRPALDLVNYAPRTFRSDMRLWVGPVEWNKAVEVWKNIFELMFFPNVLWALCINGLTLGVNIAIGTTYGTILHSPPYNWPDNSVSYINCGQIIVCCPLSRSRV